MKKGNIFYRRNTPAGINKRRETPAGINKRRETLAGINKRRETPAEVNKRKNPPTRRRVRGVVPFFHFTMFVPYPFIPFAHVLSLSSRSFPFVCARHRSESKR